MLSAADISTLDNTAQALTNPNYPNPNGSTMWAPTFYDPFQVKHRRRTSKRQYSVLERSFNENPKPNAATRRDLAEQLKMTVRGVQVWFQNRRAKAKAQRLKMAKAQKNESNASSPSESEKNSGSNNNDSSNESTSDSVNIKKDGSVNNKKEGSDNLTDKSVSSPSYDSKDLKDEAKNSLDLNNKLKLEKEYPILSNSYSLDDDVNQGMLPFPDTTPDYLHDSALGQGFDPSPLRCGGFYPGSLNMNRRPRTNSLPNVFPLAWGVHYASPSRQQLASINQTLQFPGLHHHPQLQTQAQSYSLIGGQKAASGSYSPESLQFLRQKSTYSPGAFSYSQKDQSIPSMGPSNDSTASSPSLSTTYFRKNDYVNCMTSPGLGDNIPSPHSSTSNGYSPTYQGFIPDVSTINGMRSLDDSFGYMNNPYGLTQQTLNNPYAGNIQNFVSDLNAGAGVLHGISSYPPGFNPGRRSSCPPGFLTSVNSLPLPIDENLTKQQKGLETIKEDEGIE